MKNWQGEKGGSRGDQKTCVDPGVEAYMGRDDEHLSSPTSQPQPLNSMAHLSPMPPVKCPLLPHVGQWHGGHSMWDGRYGL